MKSIITALLLIFLSTYSFAQNPASGPWRGEIDHLGGKLPFNFIVAKNKLDIRIQNGSEIATLGDSYFRGDSLVIPFDLYDSEMVGSLKNEKSIIGFWQKKRNGKTLFRIPFQAQAGSSERFLQTKQASVQVSGKYSADFWSDESNHSSGVLLLNQKGNLVTGTVLKTSGDYRFLQGNISGDSLFLSYFDGSGLMQFRCKVNGNQIDGQFYSGLAGKRNFKAIKDDKASLPDLKKLTYLKPGFDRLTFSLPNPAGKTISLQDERYKNKVVIIELMGSWCPNCLDESRFLAPYYKKMKDKGVEVIGLAFEYSPELSISGPKIENFKKRIGVDYEILFAGQPNDETIAQVLPMLHKINGYPTTFILDKSGKVREIHTGFSGPGTGVYYTDWIHEFEQTVQNLLNEK
ncbi:peroxiredoxin family protein [Aquirufa regiilacus]|uniref:TlpA disulfide reductase family protein n=1 Tax=Aquirufa regiilacus TaxID=3024868 RepID=A0ABU3TU55_9BACT|nr:MULTISPECIES: TlpA disulfide reductase family protein [unclassified Aquirufa]MDT8887595.1 TlpA disulfide reductase family protein [Aquirufa sp. LEPPI-3A]MDU0809393.1 TlpA disulfide reductase family protein [Aquirufa sp. LEOWEIH-7C]